MPRQTTNAAKLYETAAEATPAKALRPTESVGMWSDADARDAGPLTMETEDAVEAVMRINPSLARRELAARASQKQIDALVAEHNALTTAKFERGLEKKEKLRLQYVRWALDRVRDVELGDHLDRIERIIEAHESVAEDIDRLATQLQPYTKRNAPKHRR